MEEKDINLRSEELQELMGEVPPKILKVSIILLIVFTLAALTLSLLIKYPEQVQTKGMLVRSSLVQYNKDTCLVKYTASISLEQKERIKNCNMPISVTVGNNVIKGNIESISQSFSMATGLFELVASIKVPEYIIPEIIQYQDNTILTINISDKTIFNKVFLTDKIYE